MPDSTRASLAAVTAALISLWLAVPAQANDDATCSALTNAPIPGASITSAAPVAATPDLPAHCRVQGTIPQAIRFELRLPLAGWNGKFYMAGCGGFCGSLLADQPGVVNALNHGLRRGYAAATSDSGHVGANVTDGRWALDNPMAEADWGWRAVAETTRVSRDLVRAFYGKPAARSYFMGCSTGGRMGLMAAQRFPQDFDGIVAGAPALDYTGLVATQSAWIVQANRHHDGSEVLDRAKVPLIAQAVLEACDGIDGQRDGLIDDPRRCDWQPAQLQCKGAADAKCLTAREVGVLEHWYMPVTGGDGRIQYPGGVPRGSEPFWPVWLTGIPGSEQPALMERFGTDFVRYMAFVPDAGPGFDLRQYDFDRDPPRLATMSRIYDATNPDLTAFRERGGKLLLFHGWSDAIVTPQRTLDYFDAVRARMGGPEATANFARLFMLPGVDHCGLQPGPGAKSFEFDPLPALEAWVERDEAPAALDVRWQMSDGSTRSRAVAPQ
jgi:pimeloyl-ACP methyl ester carboxylesterase